jgi:protein-tyrosine phosphatase
MPLQICWVEILGKGAVGISTCPRGGQWLVYTVKDWSSEGVHAVVSLLDPVEAKQLDVQHEAELCARHGLHFIAFPIPDRGVPKREALLKLLEELAQLLRAGQRVVVHCRLGIGRSSVVLASLLVKSGISAERAFQRIAAARGCEVPDTAEQREWVCKFERQLQPPMRT